MSLSNISNKWATKIYCFISFKSVDLLFDWNFLTLFLLSCNADKQYNI